jgi:hypothetical protein
MPSDPKRPAWILLTKQEYTGRRSVAKERLSPKMIPTLPLNIIGLVYNF